LTKVVLNYFSHENIAESKRLLVQEFNSLTGVTQYLTDPQNSSVRPAHEAELDDMIGILDVADTVQALHGYLFVASNLQAMPKYGSEEINLAVVADQRVEWGSMRYSRSSRRCVTRQYRRDTCRTLRGTLSLRLS